MRHIVNLVITVSKGLIIIVLGWEIVLELIIISKIIIKLRYFLLFLLNFNIFLILTLCTAIYNIYEKTRIITFKEFLNTDFMCFIIVLVSFLVISLSYQMFSMIILLKIYHIILLFGNYTTYIRVKQYDILKIYGNPFTK